MNAWIIITTISAFVAIGAIFINLKLYRELKTLQNKRSLPSKVNFKRFDKTLRMIQKSNIIDRLLLLNELTGSVDTDFVVRVNNFKFQIIAINPAQCIDKNSSPIEYVG